ncbi:MAG: lysostaphin resistance A-like protein [Actinomycetales bacterium]
MRIAKVVPPDVEEALGRVRDRPEPRALWQYLFGFLAFLVANGAAGLVAVGVNAAYHHDLTPETAMAMWPGLTVGLFVQAIVSVALFLLMMRWLVKRPALELGRPRGALELGVGVGLGIGLMSLSVAIVAMLGGYRVTGFHLGAGLLAGLAIGVGAGFAEEIFFRGVLVRLLDKRFGSVVALVSTSLLFGLVHLTNPGSSVWGAVAIAIEAGLLLGAAYLLTRRLWLAIGIHIGWNFSQAGIFSINVSGSGMGAGGLLTSTMQGPDWLTGGSMGIEGSVVSVAIGLAAGVWLLLLARRSGHIQGRWRREMAPPEVAAGGYGPHPDLGPSPSPSPAPDRDPGLN